MALRQSGMRQSPRQRNNACSSSFSLDVPYTGLAGRRLELRVRKAILMFNTVLPNCLAPLASGSAGTVSGARLLLVSGYSPAHPIGRFDPLGTSSHQSVSARPDRQDRRQAAAAKCRARFDSDASIGPTLAQSRRSKVQAGHSGPGNQRRATEPQPADPVPMARAPF